MTVTTGRIAAWYAGGFKNVYDTASDSDGVASLHSPIGPT